MMMMISTMTLTTIRSQSKRLYTMKMKTTEVGKMEKEIKVKCTKCGYKWPYKGKSRFYACCPMCKTSIKLEGEHGKGQ